MTILFSIYIEQQDEFSFCERVLHLLEAGQHRVKVLGASEALLKKYANTAACNIIDIQAIDLVLTYTKKGLSQINELAKQCNAPIVHLVNAENIEKEYPEDVVSISKIVAATNTLDSFSAELFHKELVTPLFLPPVLPDIQPPTQPPNIKTETLAEIEAERVGRDLPTYRLVPVLLQAENKKLSVLVDIKTVHTCGYSLLYQFVPLLNALASSEFAVFHNEKPLLPLFNKNVSFISRKETDFETLFSESDLIIGSGETIYKGIASEKPCIVVGERGYGGVVILQNFDWQLKTNFQGRIGGYLNEHIPVALLTNDIQKTIQLVFTNTTLEELPESADENNEPVEKPVTDNTAKEKREQEIREMKGLLDKEFDETRKQWNNCFSTVIRQYKQRKNNLRNTKIKVSDTFVLIAFSDEKFVLTYNVTRKVHSDFGKPVADIISTFGEGCVVQDALKSCGYTDDAEMFLEFINMLLDEKILVIDG